MDKKCIIQVNEPWEFPYNRRIEGRIVRVVSPHTIVFRSDEPMEFERHRGNTFILRTRYQGASWDFDSKNEIATVGGAFYWGDDYTTESEDALQSPKNSIYVFIGSISQL